MSPFAKWRETPAETGKGCDGMRSKLVNKEEILSRYVQDGTSILIAGFGMSTVAEETVALLEKRFLETGHPRDLSIVICGGNVVLERFAHEGMIAKLYGAHFGLSKKLNKMIAENKLQAWSIPQGIITHVIRAGGQGEKGLLSKVGLGTYVDPRLEGAKMNEVTTEDVVELVDVGGEEYLRYLVPQIDLCILRGTFADEFGNVSFKDEMYASYTRYAAMCAKVQRSPVLVECREYVRNGSIPAKEAAVPGILVDYISVIRDPLKFAGMTRGIYRSAAMLGDVRIPVDPHAFSVPLDVRKVIARRASLELKRYDMVNIGIGIPETMSAVVSEEGCEEEITLSVEIGVIGGVPGLGMPFGTQLNPQAVWEEDVQFDLYHGGILNGAYLGLAETNESGDINVSRFGSTVTGSGGFIDIVAATPTIVFCGTFTAGGLQEEIRDGKLIIVQEGKRKKFKEKIQQITFSARQALLNRQKVVYVTERAVFRLSDQGLVLEEIAPGVDLERDILAQMEFAPVISPALKIMDDRLFRDGSIGLKEYLLREDAQQCNKT